MAIIEFSGELGNPNRIQALRVCAFAPTIFKEMHEQFGDLPPSDAAMRHWLVAKDFLSKAADEVIQTYRDNLDFLNRSAVVYSEAIVSLPEARNTDKVTPKVGDYVQWESQGVIQFQESRRVREIAPDGEWAFVEGSNTGVPAKELSIQLPPAAPSGTARTVGNAPPTQIGPPVQARVFQDLFSLVEGPVSIQWPASLSAESFQDVCLAGYH